MYLFCWCGDKEPYSDPSIYCPYPDDESGTWNIQTEFIHTNPGITVYVGKSFGSCLTSSIFNTIIQDDSREVSKCFVGTELNNCFVGDLTYSVVQGLKFVMQPSTLYDDNYYVEKSVSAICSISCRERMSAYMGIVSIYVHPSWEFIFLRHLTFYSICLHQL